MVQSKYKLKTFSCSSPSDAGFRDSSSGETSLSCAPTNSSVPPLNLNRKSNASVSVVPHSEFYDSIPNNDHRNSYTESRPTNRVAQDFLPPRASLLGLANQTPTSSGHNERFSPTRSGARARNRVC